MRVGSNVWEGLEKEKGKEKCNYNIITQGKKLKGRSVMP